MKSWKVLNDSVCVLSHHSEATHFFIHAPLEDDTLLSESVMEELSSPLLSSIFLCSSRRFSKRSMRLLSSLSVEPVSDEVMSDDEVLRPDLSPKALYPSPRFLEITKIARSTTITAPTTIPIMVGFTSMSS